MGAQMQVDPLEQPIVAAAAEPQIFNVASNDDDVQAQPMEVEPQDVKPETQPMVVEPKPVRLRPSSVPLVWYEKNKDAMMDVEPVPRRRGPNENSEAERVKKTARGNEVVSNSPDIVYRASPIPMIK